VVESANRRTSGELLAGGVGVGEALAFGVGVAVRWCTGVRVCVGVPVTPPVGVAVRDPNCAWSGDPMTRYGSLVLLSMTAA
jgi:hypothetical protein